MIELIDENIKSKLKLQNIITGFDYDYSDGVTLTPESYYEDDMCPDYIDLDKYETDPNCAVVDNGLDAYNVLIYHVKKGNAGFVKESILQEQSNMKMSLDNVKMNFQIKKNKESDTLYWHYKIETINVSDPIDSNRSAIQ